MLTQEERLKALQYASNGATFMFIPYEVLLNLIMANDPQIQGIPRVLKATLLQKKPIRMDTKTIVNYCLGTLDMNNSWVLDKGDIQVVPARFETKIKENGNE